MVPKGRVNSFKKLSSNYFAILGFRKCKCAPCKLGEASYMMIQGTSNTKAITKLNNTNK
jgi:hypothetical protein